MGIRSKMSGNSATPNAALARLQASVRIGGKGTVRRKKKVVHKTTTTDDKRLQNTLKRLGINSIPAIEEVNLFMDQERSSTLQTPKCKHRLQLTRMSSLAMLKPRSSKIFSLVS